MPPSVAPSARRPALPPSPALAAGAGGLRASWGWRDHDGCLVGTVATVALRGLGGPLRVSARMFAAGVLGLPAAADARGGGLTVNRGLRLAAGGLETARTWGGRRIGRDDPGLDGYVVHVSGAVDAEAARRILAPDALDALRAADLGLEWLGRELVVHAPGPLGADGRALLASAAHLVADRLQTVGPTLASAAPR